MSRRSFELNSDRGEGKKLKRFPWYWSPVFCLVWFVLFYAAVIPSFFKYPKTLLMRDERHHPDEFIGERAHDQLFGLTSLGVKLSGTVQNEVHAINFLLKEIEKIKMAARKDLYDIAVDVQYSSGAFPLWGMAVQYHNISNVIVKISPKNTKSKSYLLVNSHFDSEVDSPAAADAGVMIAVMLETLRVVSISEKPLANPIVFLFNGGEENNMLASHGFVTQHRWAPYCKAVINLDSSGGGGREVLFQTGPKSSWLLKYYHEAVRHPYANTIAEELFQNNFIPSDTDFRIFRDHGKIPGLDMAHTYNGYTYHTKYDNFANLERGTYQTTGDNILAITWALANAMELENAGASDNGQAVFYDFLGWFLISYTETTGIILNSVISASAVVFMGTSIYLIFQQEIGKAHDSKSILKAFLFIFGVQILTVVVALLLNTAMAMIMDGLGLTLSWYSNPWLIFGLYFCPMFFIMTIIPGLYIHWSRRTTALHIDDTITCFMHAHCFMLVIICVTMTGIGARSSYFPMIAIFFYTCSVALNLALSRFAKSKSFAENYYLAVHLVCQLMPFWFYTYWAFAFLNSFIPMQGRDGPENKPEIWMSLFAAIFSVHFAGFILPILHKFEKSKTFCSIFGILMLVFVVLAATPIGFPFEEETAPQRFYVLHTQRVIKDYSGRVVKNDSGFYIQPVDTRATTLAQSTFKNALPSSWIEKECREEIFCGLPLYNTRWMDWKNSAVWIPASSPHFVLPTELKLTGKVRARKTTIRYDFRLKSADRCVIYIEPLALVKLTNWSFDLTALRENRHAAHFVYHTYSMTDKALEFWLEIEHDPSLFGGPYLRLGVGAHFQYHSHTFTKEYQHFLNTFPKWVFTTNWTASYDSWYF